MQVVRSAWATMLELHGSSLANLLGGLCERSAERAMDNFCYALRRSGGATSADASTAASTPSPTVGSTNALCRRH